jgi:hypothetical protein
MAVDLRGGAAYRRITGLRESLIEEQQEAVISIDLRALDWTLTDPDEIAADRAELVACTKANPQRSVLLDKLLAGEPVIVELSALHGRLPADAPSWMTEGRGCVRVYPDDVVEPADGPAEQRAYRRG